MYTIKQAAARSGLNVPTVRAWERRYGVVHPARTPAGYRLYDDAAIDRLIAMRHLVERQGLRPSQAADQVRAGGAELAALIDRATAATETTAIPETTISTATRSGELVDAFVTAASALDVARMDRLLDEAFAAQRFEAALEDVVFPALRRVGEGWSEGSIDVSMEHAASETIRRRLVRFYESVASSSAPQVIVGLPPGCHHEIGALAFAIAARRGGLETIYLGADVPLASWLVAAQTTRAPVAVVGVIDASDVPAATEVVTALRTSPRRIAVAVGGRRAHEVGGTGIGRAVRLDRRRGRCRSGPVADRLTATVSGRAAASPVARERGTQFRIGSSLGVSAVDRDLGGHMNFNSILIGSEDPARLVDYYTKLFGEPAMSDGGYTGWQLGTGWVTVGPHDQVKGKNTTPGRILWNIETDDVQGEFDKFKAAGAIVVAEPYGFGEDQPGQIATLADPDDNYFQLMSPMGPA